MTGRDARRVSRGAPPLPVWVAFLRGINVGGKNMVPMQSLKASFERLGFRDVRTYIASGNVIFRARAVDGRALERGIDGMLMDEYGLPGKTVVRSHAEMSRLLKAMARTWDGDPAWRCNVIFLRHSIDSKRVLDDCAPEPGIERVVYCPGTLLWSVRVEALPRTAMLKLPGKAIYKEMTVRNVNTVTKVFALMQRLQTD